jgi:alpha-tubulin suppressor-like RCC1 family protein
MKKKIFLYLLIMLLFIAISVNINIKAQYRKSQIKITDIACGYWHNLFLDHKGYVYSSGANWFGQLGNSNNQNSSTIIRIYDIPKIQSISCGAFYSIALDYEGNVWAWGNNEFGQLANKIDIKVSKPKKVVGLDKVKYISAGANHCLALKNDGTLIAWGLNDRGQLGDGTHKNSSIPVQVINVRNIEKVSGGVTHSLALDKDGRVWYWGDSLKGKWVHKSADITSPILIGELKDISDIAAGKQHSVALKKDGTVWTWGMNGNGQLGIGTTSNIYIPTQIKNLNNVIKIASGESHNLALKKDGTVWSWGGNAPLGIGSNQASTIPIKVKLKPFISKIYSNNDQSIVIDSKNNLWGWGYNWKGSYGNGNCMDILSPKELKNSISKKQINTFPFSIILNKQKIHFNNEPIIINNKIFVPMDELCSFLGIKYKHNSNEIVLEKDNKSIKININNDSILDANDKNTTAVVDILSFIVNEVVYISINRVIENLSGNIVFDNKKKIIDISFTNSFRKKSISKLIINNKDENINKEQWGLFSDEKTCIDVLHAWKITKGLPSIVVGILDTGIDKKNTGLQDNIYINKAEIPNNEIDDDKNGYIDDTNGWDFANSDSSIFDNWLDDTHGTAIAEIIASSENQNNILGVAPHCSIMPMKVLSGNKGTIIDIIKAVQYAKRMNIKIVNCSFGWENESNALLLQDLLGSVDMLFVCSAGNIKDSNKFYPACLNLANTISVTSINREGKILPYTNSNSTINIAAPGEEIVVSFSSDDYKYLNGTSISTPFVSGVAALIKSYETNLYSYEIKKIILDNAIKSSSDDIKYLNAERIFISD